LRLFKPSEDEANNRFIDVWQELCINAAAAGSALLSHGLGNLLHCPPSAPVAQIWGCDL